MTTEIEEREDEIEEEEAPPSGTEVEVRSATSLEVRFDERMIEIVAVPYGEVSHRAEYRGRQISEIFQRGAFEGVQMRARSFPVLRAHDVERPLGWVRKFKPREERGLVAELGPISRTRDGDDALELAADGLLGASVGFSVLPGGERWTPDRSSRMVTKAWLRHIALTGEPAYPGAKVLSVRSAAAARVEAPPGSATPNLDRVLAEMMAARYSRPQPST